MRINIPKIDLKKFLDNKCVKTSLRFAEENQHLITVILIFLLALGLRLWDIVHLPGGFSEQERAVVESISTMSSQKLWLGGKFYQAGYLYTAYVWTKIFGLNILCLRILSAIIGTLTIVFCYQFISKWFNKKIAIFMSFLFSISFFHISVSRLILPDILFPALMLILFNLLTVAYRKKNIWYFGLSGFVTGLGFYTSPAFILVPILFLISAGYFYLKNKKFIIAYKNELLVAAAAFLASSIPFIVSFAIYPMNYLTHFGFNRSFWQIIMNIGQIPTMLFVSTGINYFINIGTEPLLDPFIFITSIAGFLLALFGLARRKYFFLVFWFVMVCLYAAMKRGVMIVDLIGMLPVIYTFSALILSYVISKWFKTFPYNKSARVLIIGIIAVFFALSALYNFDRYFVAYKNSNRVKEEFSAQPPIPIK